MTDRFAVMEVMREDEFSPLKNASGAASDTPETSRRDVLDQSRRWLLAAGAVKVVGEVEISPLVSYAGEGLEKLRGRVVTRSGHMASVGDLM